MEKLLLNYMANKTIFHPVNKVVDVVCDMVPQKPTYDL